MSEVTYSKYEKSFSYLTEHPEQIPYAWNAPDMKDEFSLFEWATPDGDMVSESGTYYCGCLTQVKDGTHNAWNSEVTKAIRCDGRIPSNPNRIEPRHLIVFLEWRRKLANWGLDSHPEPPIADLPA